MKQKKVQSLSRKLFVNFILSCSPSNCSGQLSGVLSVWNLPVSGDTQPAENNTKLISAYMTKYLNDIDNLTKAPYYHSFFQSRTLLRT